MELGAVVQKLGIAGSERILRTNWEQARSAMPEGGILFLSPQFIDWACEVAYLTKGMARSVGQAARRIAGDEALRTLAWYCHYNLVQETEGNVPVREWPELRTALDKDAGMFYVVVLLSLTAEMNEVHRERNIPDAIVRDTVLDLKLCMNKEDFREDYGHWGISPRILAWLLLHWRGRLYRLGRLQFVPDVSRARLSVFRNRSDNTVLALSEMGMEYRADGQVNGAGDVWDREGAWTSFLSATDTEIVGSPISPRGYAIERQVRLAAGQWQAVMSPGDPVLAVHIPAGSPMDFGTCGKSIAKALEFFPRYFPERLFVAFMCHSWILDAQFEELLPESSNLVRFQKEVYLFPVKSSSAGVIKTVFGRKVTDISSAPRHTTMQRAFAKHIEGGGQFRGGGCFLFPQDFAWGEQVYRSQALPFTPPDS